MRAYTELVRHAGNAALFDAVELSLLSLQMGWPLHLHAQGARGAGKTTILRAARGILPPIRRVRGCLYNCDPDAPHCPQHAGMDPEELARLGSEWIPTPFLEISHSAKLGTVVGTIDLRRITDARDPQAVLLPGTLAKAHRGIVFVDEINRLADTAPELADVLLDVMGTRPGRLQIEEAGLAPVELTVSVAVWAASNPDEEPGPLEDVRRQLSDRFDLSVLVGRPESAWEVRAILDRSAAGTRLDEAASARLQELRRRLSRQGVAPVPPLSESLRDLLADVFVRFRLESLRAVEAWQWTARLHALRAGRRDVQREDLAAVAPVVLQHRVDPRTLADILEALQGGERQRVEAPAGAGALPRPGEPGSDAGLRPQGRPGASGRAGEADGDGRAAGGLGRLLGRVRGWWDAHPAAAGASVLSGAGGAGAGAGSHVAGGGQAPGADGNEAGRRGSARAGSPPVAVPEPPHAARALVDLDPEEVARRLSADPGTDGAGSGAGRAPWSR